MIRPRSKVKKIPRSNLIKFDKFWDSILISILVAAFSYKSLFMFAKLDFDRHHDGIMLAQAMAVEQGFTVHKDLLAQYGPITPWLHSLFLKLDLFGPLLTLRFATTVFIVFTIFLMSDLGRVSPPEWKVTPRSSKIAAVTWLILCDVWIGTTMLPWSSVIATFFIIAGIYALAYSQKNVSLGKFFSGATWAFFAGLMVGVTPFTRLNVGLLAVIFLISLTFVFLRVDPFSWNRTTKPFCFGVLISLLTTVFILISIGALRDFYLQAIMWPREWAPDAISGWKTKENLIRILLEQIIPVTAIFIFAFKKSKYSRVVDLSFSIIMALGIFAWQTWLGFNNSEFSGSKIISDFNLLGKNIFKSYLEFFLVVIGLSVSTLVALAFRNFRTNLKKNIIENSGFLILGLSAISLEVQIVPTWDSRHIWWGLPAGLLLFFALLDQNRNTFRFFLNPIFPQIFIIGLMALAIGLSHLKVKREPFIDSSASIARGMKLSAHEVAWLAEDAEFLRNEIGTDKKAIFYVWNGYLSVINGTYISEDEFFIEFGEASNLKNRISDRAPIIVEDVFMNLTLKKEIESLGYTLDNYNLHLFIFKSK